MTRVQSRATLQLCGRTLTTCVKLTAIFEKLTHAATWPMLWKNATGKSAFHTPRGRTGRGCKPVSHRKDTNRPLAPSCQVEMSQGMGKSVRHVLLMILKATLKTYHNAKYTARRGALDALGAGSMEAWAAHARNNRPRR